MSWLGKEQSGELVWSRPRWGGGGKEGPVVGFIYGENRRHKGGDGYDDHLMQTCK